MKYLTVSALNKYIKTKLEYDEHLSTIKIKGEISNFKKHSRGHLYFTRLYPFMFRSFGLFGN